MGLKLENLALNVHSLELPSPLWGLHIDERLQFIALVYVNVYSEKVSIDKGIVLSEEICGEIKTCITLRDEVVKLPHILNSEIESISDLSTLICRLHDIKFCWNFHVNQPKCSKYLLKSVPSDFCDYCSFQVFQKEEPDPNLETLSSLGELFKCDQCNEEFLTQNLLVKHLENHTKGTSLCTVCGNTFCSKSALVHHMHLHTSERPFKCEVCGKSFTKKYNLKVHVRVHSGERPYSCPQCGRTFSTRSNYSTHINSLHRELKKHACELCGKTFVHPRILRIHMRKHTGEKPFSCKVCANAFAKKVHLTIHMRTHTGEKPFLCWNCGKGFTTSGNLNAHQRANHKNDHME